mmetsp:Transcript_17400/g.20482  ORF Transcript_17400/g.20482 Transcript_17400/m.20482 type:complete len:588 (+) Transcript_17400:11-1774(+)
MAQLQEKGVVFTWGSDKETGALGHQSKDKDGHCSLPMPVGLNNCIFVSAAANLSAAITDKGELFTWGKGPAHGHENEKNGVVFKPKLVLSMKSHFVLQVSLGSMHTLCLCRGGIVFSWGNNRKGQLGIGQEIEEKISPSQLSKFTDVIDVQCCDLYSALLTNNGQLFTWGTSICLGHSVDIKANIPLSSTEFIPKQVSTLECEHIVQVSLGSVYMGCCTLNGKVFCWGYGGHGNLGLGDRKSKCLPTQIISFDKKENNVSSHHAIALVCTTSQQSMGGGMNPKNPGQEGPHSLLIVQKKTTIQSQSKYSLHDNNNKEFISEPKSIDCKTTGEGEDDYGGDRDDGDKNAFEEHYEKSQEVKSSEEKEGNSAGYFEDKKSDVFKEDNSTFVHERQWLYAFGTCHKGLCGNLQAKTLSAPFDELTPYLVGSQPRDVKTSKSNRASTSRAEELSENNSEINNNDNEEEEDIDNNSNEPLTRSQLLGNVVGASASSIHNLVWNDRGELYAFGCGSGGRCGVGYFVIGANPNKSRKSRMKAYMSAPNRVGCVWPPTSQHKKALDSLSLKPTLDGAFVTMAAASRYHGICIANV